MRPEADLPLPALGRQRRRLEGIEARAAGFLCLGTRENIQFAPSGADFTPFNAHARIYRVNAA